MMRKYFTEGDLISVGINTVHSVASYICIHVWHTRANIVSKLVDMHYITLWSLFTIAGGGSASILRWFVISPHKKLKIRKSE